ncbi:MAG: calcium/sodium antiporter [Bacteroidales bacterium]|nr:calcium/sodium antiporter [Bacteroidales bacterium]MBQ6689823.1 calcium/sodium antiporter [Bacteroidales bacterium]
MEIFSQIALLLLGLILILLGANALVDGSSSIAKKSGLSEFLIGLTIVGIGTSTPEMVVSFMSSFQGNADMSIGNIVGSNIFNTLMILGVTALISPLVITKGNLRKDIPLNIFVTILLIILGMNFSIFGIGQNKLNRIDGIILLTIFVLYMWHSFRHDTPTSEEDSDNIKEYSIARSILMIAAGLCGLIIGGRLFVNSSTDLAHSFGISDKFIAITVMAAGTSMPELATCVVAAFKGRGQLALGNILGSNISNILLILGGASLINPLSFTGMTTVDMGILLASSVFILLSAYIFRKKSLDRVEGIILLLLEAGYMWYLIINI